MSTLTKVLTFKAVIVALLLTATVSCSDNQMARGYGGSFNIDLKPNERVSNVTWKGTDLWILTKQDTTKPTTYTFKEKSTWGVLEGEITINEQ